MYFMFHSVKLHTYEPEYFAPSGHISIPGSGHSSTSHSVKSPSMDSPLMQQCQFMEEDVAWQALSMLFVFFPLPVIFRAISVIVHALAMCLAKEIVSAVSRFVENASASIALSLLCSKQLEFGLVQIGPNRHKARCCLDGSLEWHKSQVAHLVIFPFALINIPVDMFKSSISRCLDKVWFCETEKRMEGYQWLCK